MKYSELTSKIIQSAMEVHNILRRGYPEIIYKRALAIEFGIQNIAFVKEHNIEVHYKKIKVADRRVDFLVQEFITVEVKATSALDSGDYVQALNYLEANNLEIGLLINFGAKSLQFHRLTNKNYIPL